mmetsp:Transcript_47026/g.124587  ORF Transcript_47026/g.124587 Transcript_47026/m.124587 type:complete len:251 (-) Transcript_47026:533-1285(-)
MIAEGSLHAISEHHAETEAAAPESHQEDDRRYKHELHRVPRVLDEGELTNSIDEIEPGVTAHAKLRSMSRFSVFHAIRAKGSDSAGALASVLQARHPDEVMAWIAAGALSGAMLATRAVRLAGAIGALARVGHTASAVQPVPVVATRAPLLIMLGALHPDRGGPEPGRGGDVPVGAPADLLPAVLGVQRSIKSVVAGSTQRLHDGRQSVDHRAMLSHRNDFSLSPKGGPRDIHKRALKRGADRPAHRLAK